VTKVTSIYVWPMNKAFNSGPPSMPVRSESRRETAHDA
jgi:hypothetical protein